MNEQNTQKLGIVTISREFDAPQNLVFEAFTNPEIMSQWFYAFPEGRSKVEADLRVGGTYSVDMIPNSDSENDGECCSSHYHHGEYLEIDAPNRLVFTWINPGFVDHSIVTLEFEKIAENKTLLKLNHQVPTETVEAHNQGWNGCLANLEKHLS